VDAGEGDRCLEVRVHFDDQGGGPRVNRIVVECER